MSDGHASDAPPVNNGGLQTQDAKDRSITLNEDRSGSENQNRIMASGNDPIRQGSAGSPQGQQPFLNGLPPMTSQVEHDILSRTNAGSEIDARIRDSINSINLSIPSKSKDEIEDWILGHGVASWNHESGSSLSGRPSLGWSTSTSLLAPDSRRPNPKSIETRKSSRAASAAARSDVPQIDWKPRAHVEEAGTLFRISDAVPYLLGPSQYLDAIVRLGAWPIPEASCKDDKGNFVMNATTATALDRVIVMVLTLLRTSEDKRPSAATETLEGFSTHEDRLVVYKDVGGNIQPKLVAIHLYDFMGMVVGWEQLPNPALVAEDRPGVVTPWADIAQMLRERRIRIEDIDRGLYEELTMMAQPLLSIRLDALARSNELQQRKQPLPARPVAAAARGHNVAHITLPMETDDTVLYAKRFSHKHPRGYLIDPAKEPYDMMLFPEERAAHERKLVERERQRKASTSKNVKESLRQKRRRWAKSKYGQRTKWTLLALFALGIVALILCLLYFHVGSKSGNSFGQD